MAYDIEEQENLENLKAWWKSYGNIVIGVLVVALLALAGWNGWKWYQRDQAGKAMVLFEALERAAPAGETSRVKDAAGNILEHYGSTGYAPRAALLAADILAKAGDAKTAQAQLQWVVDHNSDAALVPVARLRLAGMLLDAKNFDAALTTLSPEPPAAFAALYADRRGDILAAQGKKDDARKAYTEALGKLDPGSNLRPTTQLKLDALGES